MKKHLGKCIITVISCISVIAVACAAVPYEKKPEHEVREITYVETEEEKKIYSYVQVPENYCFHKGWSGDWNRIEAGGQQFFYFGCGVCCLANMCSTLTPNQANPGVMFEWARKYTDYNPDCGVGALSWKQLEKMCGNMGLSAAVKRKPADYSIFQEDVRASDTTMVLVCKYDDDKLWFYTKGHYVNLWNYDSGTDTVFVTDSSGLFNRDRVQLEDVYRALKTSSEAQYLCVNAE